MLRAKHMGFKSVRRVEVKAETTTPTELRPQTDASGARVSASRGRRTLPKLEFTVDEDGAVLHGPQRGSYPFYTSPNTNPNAGNMESTTEERASAPFNTALERDLAASFQALHMRDFPSPPSNQDEFNRRSSNEEDEPGCNQEEEQDEEEENDATRAALPATSPPMKECVLNDTRATTLAVKYDNAVGKFVCGSSIERFSGHTGVCRVLGSKKYPIIPHSLRLGDLLRIGSVGLVVCEVNRTTSEETEEALTPEQYEFLKENYLSLPLQQTFHPTEQDPDGDNNEEHLDDDKNEHERAARIGGDTSDEGESEEDRKGGRDSSGDGKGSLKARNSSTPLGVAGIPGKRVRLEDGRVVSLLAKKLPPPYVTFAVVTQHETRNRSTALTNTRFQLSFANLPRNQQFLTIGRSTTNNMTLRYRTVSQLHAKVKFQDNHFFLFDAASSNGTMLFLSKPLELDWNKTMHVKIGRTILTLKAKKKWKWAGTGAGEDDEEEEIGRVSSPRISSLSTPRCVENGMSSPLGLGSAVRSNGFDLGGSHTISDPSAELVAAPYRSNLSRTYTAPNVLSSRLNRSAISSSLNSRTRQRSLSSTAPAVLHGDSGLGSVHELTAFQVDELEPDESETFAAQAVRDPTTLDPPSTSFRDFAIEGTSPSLTTLLAGEGVGAHGNPPTRMHQELSIQRRGLYDLVDSLAERGASPIVATLSPAGRLTERD
ncbi:hypothetical protein BBO99_00008190 [Phytophthora kernoviae]|uniref:FHA domain-containing protein n=1 Tax=Phytophthora kernoviae TaxID=325452 RepID=A0A3R7J736_9STRA|nr:hypothetical protein JM16_007774 [Phytophthora kernoviae]RLN13894.1 hypothetical protein BBI17_008132 [Phytophthora kernoviae]RLN75635.1 hypothetical protein BBO99_00008190 [Phytophthora kernoviae]